MDLEIDSNKSRFASLETIFNEEGFNDFKWIAPEQIVVAQWVRMKCMFGCPNYGRKGACPPQILSVSDCERFFDGRLEMPIFGLKTSRCRLTDPCFEIIPFKGIEKELERTQAHEIRRR